MKINFLLIPILIILTLVSCKPEEKNNTPTEIIADKVIEPIKNKEIDLIEKSHSKQRFLKENAITYNFHLIYKGTDRMKAKVTLSTDSQNGLFELSDGNKMYFNKNKVFVSPELAESKKARFDAYTWSYFFLFPYKLSDPGTKWSEQITDTMNGKDYDIQTLTFEAGTGDAPDDWYVVYSNPETKKIEVAAYIVTVNKTKEEAEENPHAIKYDDYTSINNIDIATKWSLWNWSKENGLSDQLADATLSNVEFIKTDDNFFTPPVNFIEK